MAKTDIHMIRQGPGWVPADQHAEEWSRKFKDGDEVVFTRKVVRDARAERRFFAMLRKVIDNVEQYNDTEELREALLIATGNYTWRHDLFGRLYRLPKSFTDFDTETFAEFEKKSLKLIGEQLGIDATELMREVDGTQKWTGPRPWDKS